MRVYRSGRAWHQLRRDYFVKPPHSTDVVSIAAVSAAIIAIVVADVLIGLDFFHD